MQAPLCLTMTRQMGAKNSNFCSRLMPFHSSLSRGCAMLLPMPSASRPIGENGGDGVVMQACAGVMWYWRLAQLQRQERWQPAESRLCPARFWHLEHTFNSVETHRGRQGSSPSAPASPPQWPPAPQAGRAAPAHKGGPSLVGRQDGCVAAWHRQKRSLRSQHSMIATIRRVHVQRSCCAHLVWAGRVHHHHQPHLLAPALQHHGNLHGDCKYSGRTGGPPSVRWCILHGRMQQTLGGLDTSAVVTSQRPAIPGLQTPQQC